MANPAPRALPPSVEGYGVPGSYDEAYESQDRPREVYADVMAGLAGVDLHALTDAVNARVVERGVTFGGADGHAFRIDPVPRIISGEEWSELTVGLGQRVRALDAFLDDTYGDRRAVAEGIIPEHVIAGSAYLEPELAGVQPRAGARISVAGLDLVRGGDGHFYVLEDNVRTPSGITYALAASDAVTELSPLDRPAVPLVERLRDGLRGVIEATAPDVDGELVLLTDGPGNSAYYEHRTLAELCGLQLRELGDLRGVGDHVETTDGARVRAVYRRTDDDAMRDAAGEPTPLVGLLLEPLRAGTVGLVNWFGTGVADDKEVYSYVDDLVRFYLGEEPRLRSVPTYHLREPGALEEVLDRIAELVVKPRDGYGGRGVVVGPTAAPEELEEARAALRSNPTGWIAQDVVALSTHPTVIDGTLAPRHVDLRPFVFFDGETAVVPPGGLTRVALQEGSMVVNSSRNGGGKPTWVLAASEEIRPR